MPDTLPPTQTSPKSSDKRKRADSSTVLLKWVTVLSLIGSFLFGLSFVVCFRYDQRAIAQPDGSLIWHEEGLHRGGWFVADATLNVPEPPAAKPIVEWLGLRDRERMPLHIAGLATWTDSGTPLVTLPLLVLLITAAIWTRRLFVNRRNRKRADRCRECGYEKAGLDLPTCPECGAPWAGIATAQTPPSSATRRRGADAALTVACAFVALSLSGLACELSFRIWIDWLILWPVLIVVCTPLFVLATLARPKTLALLAIAIAIAWLLSSHTDVYAYVLVHWVRSPGVPGSKGLEPETIKTLYRCTPGVLLILAAALTAYAGPQRARSAPQQQAFH